MIPNRHLFHIPLNNFEAAEIGVDFYFTQSNSYIRQAAHKVATPEAFITGKFTNEVIAAISEWLGSSKSL